MVSRELSLLLLVHIMINFTHDFHSAMSISAKEVLSSTNLKAEDLPTRIVSDKYMYTSRLGDEIRITSIGEFSGWSTQPTPEGE